MADGPSAEEVQASLGKAIVALADRARSEGVASSAETCANATLALAQAVAALGLPQFS